MTSSSSSSADPTHHTSGRSGATPLHFAAANGHTHIVGLLLSWGAKAEAIDKHGVTPVELAAEGGHDDVRLSISFLVTLLIRNLDRLDTRGVDSNTPERVKSGQSGARSAAGAGATRRGHAGRPTVRLVTVDGAS